MRALVTGATGFLGSHLARALVARGHDVVVLVRELSDRSRLADVPLTEAVGDVTDQDSFIDAAHGADVVFHAAAMYAMGPSDPRQMEAVNVDGVEHAVAAAQASGATLVHVSSVSALGPSGSRVSVDESFWSDERPATHYARTKRAGHLVARAAARRGLDVRIASPGGIYGPGDTSTLGNMIERYMSRFSPIGWRPEGYQSTVHVDDCAEGLILVAERGRPGEEYVLCAECVTFREWFRLIAAAANRRPPVVQLGDRTMAVGSRILVAAKPLLGSKGPLVGEYAATIGCDFAYSGEKARRHLGWTPRPLEQGMREYAEAIGAR